MAKFTTIQGVRGYCDEQGKVWLYAEDVARGLGWIQRTAGKEYVKWYHLNHFMQELGFSTPTQSGDFIEERTFYLLAMRARNDAAKKFQSKIADEILPSIRKTGVYVKYTAPELQQPKANSAQSKLIDVQSQADESQSKAIDVQSQVDESQSKSIDVQSQVNESQSKAVDVQSQVNESQSKAVDVQSQVDRYSELVNDPDLIIAMATEIKHQREQIAGLNKTNAILKPKADYCDAVLTSRGSVPVTVIAKEYGMSGQRFNALLVRYDIEYKVGDTWVLKAQYAGKGYTTTETQLKNGVSYVLMTWTQRGREFLYHFLKERGIVPVRERVKQLSLFPPKLPTVARGGRFYAE